MEWKGLRFDWNRARAFLVSAEEGSFSAAARALAVAQPTVGRQVAALEEELGVTLFERVGTSLSLTTAGLDLVEHVRTMAEAATRVSLTAAGKSTSLEGSVCITASELISAHVLPPMLVELRRRHPGIHLEIVASNGTRDLRRREADIAVRNFQPTQPELVATKIGDRRAYFYATPGYLRRLGHPEDVDALIAAEPELFGFGHSDEMRNALARFGLPLERRHFPILTENHLVQWEMCKRGAGICIVMEEVGDREPRVRRVLPDLGPLPVPLWLVTHRELRTSRRIRVVFDHLAAGLRASDPERNDADA